jgi:hypothetical protein
MLSEIDTINNETENMDTINKNININNYNDKNIDIHLLWYNIDEIILTNNIKYNILTNFDKNIIDNNITNINKFLEKGELIYYTQTLCCGIYQKKFKTHPIKCHSLICHKTSVYYALWMNNYYATKIYFIIIEILKTTYIINYDKEDIEIQKIKNIIKNIIDVFTNINCNCNIKTNVYYNDNNFNYGTIYETYKNIPLLINLLSNLYGYTQLQINNDDITDINKIEYDMECFKVNIININDNNNDLYGDIDLQKTHINKLEKLWNKYKTNNEIVILMFNQQLLEYYKYALDNNLIYIDKTIDEIKKNKYIDVNYQSLFDKHNMYSMTIYKQDAPEILNKLHSIGCHLPEHYDKDTTIINIMNTNLIKNLKEFIRTCDDKYFFNIYQIFTEILHYNMMRTIDKLEIIEFLVFKGVLDNVENIISIILKHELSLQLLEKIINRKVIINKANIYDITLCIQLIKYRELNLLLKSNITLIDGKNNIIPLFVFLTELKNENELIGKNILKSLLDNKPNINVKDNLGRTPLILAVIMKKNMYVEMLLKYNSNSFEKDDNGYNCLHHAIINECINIIEQLKDIEHNKNNETNENDNNSEKKLINEKTNNNKNALLLALETNMPLKITKILLTVSNIDYYFLNENNDNILHHIINTQLTKKEKTEIFKCYIETNIIFDLISISNYDSKPLILRAVENNLFHVVIMILCKLLKINEIKLVYDDTYVKKNDFDIYYLLQNNKIKDILPIDTKKINFYPLIILYLKEEIKMVNISNNSVFLNVIIIYLFIYFIVCH